MKDKNEQRAFIAISLSLVALFFWNTFFVPKPAADATAVVSAAGPTDSPSGVSAVPAAPVAALPAGTTAVVAETCTPGRTPLTTTEVNLELENCGGGIATIQFPAWQSPATVTPWWTWLWQTVSGKHPGAWAPYVPGDGAEHLLSKDGRFAVAGRGNFDIGGAFAVVNTSPLTLRRTAADGFVVTEVFTPTADPGVMDLKVRFEGNTPLQGPFWVGVLDAFGNSVGAYDSHAELASVVKGEYAPFTKAENLKDEEDVTGPLSWFGVGDRYFLAALMPADPNAVALRYARVDEKRVGAFAILAATNVDAAHPVEASFTVYTGSKDVERVTLIGHDLDEAVALGMFGFFSKILLFFLHIFQSLIGNWGLSIIALTFLVRISFYPLSAKAFRSAKRMQAVQPLLKELQEKYKDDKDAVNRETMALFKKYDVNPIGGCLPMLLQMPVFFALYSALLHTPDLFHAHFLYVLDLSAPDPFGAFPAFMAAGMILQQRLTPTAGMDPQQAQMMKFMPVMFALFMFGLPAGLSLYYAVNTILSIAQQWYNTQSIQPVQLGELNANP